MKEQIYNLLKINKNIHLNFYDIKRNLHLKKKNVNEELKTILDQLELEGVIFCDENGIYQNFPPKYKIATINQTKHGKYTAINDNNSYAINDDDLNGALSSDKVIIEPVSKKRCKVIKVVQRNHHALVCEVKFNDDLKKVVKPINVNQDFDVSIGYNSLKKLVLGTRILVDISKEKFDDMYEADFVEVIGHKDDPDIDLECIALSNGFKTKFDEKSLKEAEKIPYKVSKKDYKDRVDLTNDTIFTIDCENTKDMDDAVSCKKLDNGNYLLQVHIAHVSHYIKKGSSLFNEAVERGNSLYQLDSVMPMLPHSISNGICSLNEGEDRLTRTVSMEINPNGQIIKSSIFKSVINSKKKMTYDKVNEYFNTNVPSKDYEPFVEDLNIMKQLYYILDKKFKNEGYICFDSSEIEFNFTDEGIVESHHIEEKGIAQKMIEYFMVLTNSTVSEYIYWQKLPFTYRNHGVPNDYKLDKTIQSLNELGYALEKINDISNPKNIQRLLANLSDKDNFPILSTFILKSMQRASYGTENIGHYGLSLGYYTHFTSPIRRVIDLTVHTLLDYYEASDNYVDDKLFDELLSELDFICKRANLQERNADIAEVQSNQLALVKYYEDKIGLGFNMYVTEINSSYLCVKSCDLVEGIIPLRELGIKYNIDEKSHLVSVEGIRKPIALGSMIRVNLMDTSREYRELYFTFRHLYKKENREKQKALIYKF